MNRILTTIAAGLALATFGHGLAGGGQPDGVRSPSHTARLADFDIVHTQVLRVGRMLRFNVHVSGKAGATHPAPNGQLAGSTVFSYVWPTNLDSSVVGFDHAQGVLALAATSHPDFDDTPLYDENGDSDPHDDGDLWHAHWVVLVPDDACGPGALKVKDIPAGSTPKLPATWPNLPILIDSPALETKVGRNTVSIDVPLAALGFPKTFQYDGVTAALRVNGSVHAPLLCVADVFKIASGDLSLPGTLH